MNASCGKDVSQVLVAFADVVACPFTHFEPVAFFNSVKLMHCGFLPSLGLTSPAAILMFLFSSLHFSTLTSLHTSQRQIKPRFALWFHPLGKETDGKRIFL